MVLKPIKRSVVPSPLSEATKFEELVTQYLNKCDDLLSYTRRYPTVKETLQITLQRQNRNPHENHRWLRRNVTIESVSYDELKSLLFVNRSEHMPRWMPQMMSDEKIECIVPNLCEVHRFSFKSAGLKSKRDYCQLVVKREFIGDAARPKPRIFTPSASMANLAVAYRSQSSSNLPSYAEMNQSASLSPAPLARSVVDFHDTSRDPSPYGNTHFTSSRLMDARVPPLPTQPQQQLSSAQQVVPQSNYVGLAPQDSMRNHNDSANPAQDDDDDTAQSSGTRPIRRFQIVTVPMLHKNCTEQRGFVRAVYESYEEVREYEDGRLEWICIYHSDFSGWIPSFMADHSIAQSFPKEADALLDYVQKSRAKSLNGY
ncbi:hypothetical protein H4R24_003975 [Coemansia sp. RSA 988]|nr:hypothetical protein H4R24_003975 [Coemansia sp. RSA 988]